MRAIVDTETTMTIVPLGEERGDEVSALCGKAFQDDPMFSHACPDPGA